MRKQYWTIIQPDGKPWANSWWDNDIIAWRELDLFKHPLNRRAWGYIDTFKEEGYRVVKIWVEIEGE